MQDSSDNQNVVIGINLPNVHANPEALRKALAGLQAAEFDCVEIRLADLPLIINGRVMREYVDFVRSILREHGLRYTTHIGRGLDLRDQRSPELHRRVLRSSIEASASLGAELLVLHYEAHSKDQLIEERFVEAHGEAADYAAGLGVRLGLENIEVERVEPVIECVRKIAHRNLVLALDVGHAFLAAQYYHIDFLQSLRQALPYVGHVHLSDNAGTFEELRITDRAHYDVLPVGYRFTYGRGDIHIPPFWGEIPYPDVFALLRDYRGIYLCEYKSEMFLPFNASIRQRVRAAVLEARSSG